ncbi:acyl-coenzyme A thioesterase 8 isoform 2-T2 [Spinachia spinachia]
MAAKETGESEHTTSPEDDLRSVLVTSVLNLEELDLDLYRGTHHWVPRSQRLFGGQILTCQASFHMQQPSPLQHQFTMPLVPQPEDLLTVEELIHLYLSKPDLAEKSKQGLNKLLANEVPIEIKPVNPPHSYRRAASEPKKLFWVRARGHIGEGNMKLHCCVAAYVSDFALLDTALLPYPNHRAHFSASLDHAMWFHSTFRADEWMLYECESPWAGGSRALVQGRLWRRDGVLAASCSQEGLLRVKEVAESSKL